MTEPSKKNLPEDGDIEIPAIRHVGPTLESDPEYLEALHSGYSTPEAQIAAEAARTEPDLHDLSDADEEIDLLSGREGDIERPEPLKTRLPGDTSSDPHTDVGPGNAATVQKRGERKRKAA
ncbi:MAG TPA: hypothetical protein VL991_10435 [Terracidiphilus sp.]|jgi:hypothetical protein|nr:hypothetical protein [Terracidiphilus sp.]